MVNVAHHERTHFLCPSLQASCFPNVKNQGFAGTFTVYPSLSGSISEAARRLHVHM